MDIHAAAAECLPARTHKTLYPWPQKVSRRVLNRAWATLGHGPDHLVGEAPVAMYAYRLQPWLGALVTTHRAFCYSAGRATEVRYEDVDEVRYKAGLLGWVQVRERGEWRDVLTTYNEPMGRFLERAHRIEPPPPMPPPRTVEAARDEQDLEEPRIDALLSLLEDRDDPDLVARVIVLYRTIVGGRGRREGWWISAASPRALVDLLAAQFGEAEIEHDGPEEVSARFAVGSMGSDIAKNAAVAAAQLALDAPVGLPGLSVKTVWADVRRRDGWTSFTLEGTAWEARSPLHELEAAGLATLFDRLPDLEAIHLLTHILIGEGPASEAQVREAAQEAGVDPELFYAPEDAFHGVFREGRTPPELDWSVPEIALTTDQLQARRQSRWTRGAGAVQVLSSVATVTIGFFTGAMGGLIAGTLLAGSLGMLGALAGAIPMVLAVIELVVGVVALVTGRWARYVVGLLALVEVASICVGNPTGPIAGVLVLAALAMGARRVPELSE